MLMSLWRDGANRLMQARASAKLIEISDDGTLDWHSSAIPEHKIAFRGSAPDELHRDAVRGGGVHAHRGAAGA